MLEETLRRDNIRAVMVADMADSRHISVTDPNRPAGSRGRRTRDALRLPIFRPCQTTVIREAVMVKHCHQEKMRPSGRNPALLQ